jgi:putative ATP-binding cassette transporter
MDMTKLGFLRKAWHLAAPYWFSEERWFARGLLALIIAINVGTVLIDVRLNSWRADFYNSLQDYDGNGFVRQCVIFFVWAAIWMGLAVYSTYLNQMLQIRWRRWLTRRYLDRYLANRAYYRIQLADSGTDNPDQRIADDLNLFCVGGLSLLLGLFSAVLSVVSFLIVLWAISGDLEVPLGAWGTFVVPSYLVWIAIVYAGIGTWLTIKIGRPLVGLNYFQQRYEADFRFSLVRLRENAESIAFYGGEPREREVFERRFGNVFGNFWSLMKRQKHLGWLTSGYAQAIVLVPYLAAAPRYFSKQIQLGEVQQIAGAFDQVQSALSFIVARYTDIAQWQAVIERLSGFEQRVVDVEAAAEREQPIAVTRAGEGVAVHGLELDLPDGTPLRRDVQLEARPGDPVLVTGRTGSGKSTLLRAVAGLWPFGKGNVRLGEGAAFFVPQKPYLPLGTLRDVLAYPASGTAIPEVQLEAALREVGLGSLAGRLDETDNWAQRLSLGEQQRLAFARLLLAKPSIVFLDEATSALDEAGEAELYRKLRDAPWRPTIVSVGHRGSLRGFHGKIVDFGSPEPAVAAS